ncbi:MAG: PAS domain S-box protein [Chloroflexi bacterium]|nr:PAS domain S-box protein [Chloroflexota bacterium]OJV88216.1 MAG: hypothetical protein BGO39_08490 [Chloroflexi bacterium 54-19]
MNLENHKKKEAAKPIGFAGLSVDNCEPTQIEQSLIRLAAIVQFSQDAIISWDLDGKIVSWNKGAEKLYGYSAQEAISRHISFITPPELKEEIPAILARLKQGEIIEQHETVRVTKDGRRVFISLSVSPLKDRTGKIFGASVIGRDITERIKAEKARRASQDQGQLLLESTAEGIYGVDLAGNCTFSNLACTRLLGYKDPRQLIGKNMHALIHHTKPNGTPCSQEECQIYQAFYRNEGYHIDTEVLWRADGTSFPAEYWSYPVSREGQVIGAVVTFLDITERKAAEELLRQTKERFILVARATSDIIWDWNILSGEIWWNENIQKFQQPGKHAQTGTGILSQYEWWLGFVHPADRARVAAGIWQAIEKGDEFWSAEYRFAREDGSYGYILDRGHIIHNQTGIPVRMVGAMLDLTERRQSEEALQQTREQLRQAQKMEAIGRLAGGVAHDFNNILTGIMGYTELVMNQLDPANPLAQSLEEIRKGVDRAAALTHQLLAFSRSQVLQPKLVDLNQLVENIYQLLKRVIRENIEVVVKLQPAIGMLKADPIQLEQILLNLAINSSDAMPHGGQLILETKQVELEEAYAGNHFEARPGHYIMLAVTDNGCGMSKKTQSHIFEPFFTTKDLGKGTGLGLSTVYGIVKQSGGFINVYSEVEVGTTFKIYLPVVHETIVAEEPPYKPIEISHGSETILLVEDDEMLREVAGSLLELSGYRVLATGRPEEAISIVKNQPETIHLVLTDIIMPAMSGRELAARLRHLRPDLRIAYMSGYTGEIARCDSDNNIMDPRTFIEKPFTRKTLLTKIREILESPAPTT